MIRTVAVLGVWLASIPVVSAQDVRPTARPGAPGARSVGLAASGPEWFVTGTILAPPTKAALVVGMDQEGRETGSVRVNEGETVGGYRVIAVEEDRVSLERSGQLFTVRLGRSLPSPGRDAPPTPPGEVTPGTPDPELARGGRPVAVTGASPSRGLARVVGPDRSPRPDADELRHTVQPALEALRDHPRFRQKMEQVTPVLQRRLEESRAAGSDPHADRPDAPAQSARAARPAAPVHAPPQRGPAPPGLNPR
jgi:hypothetical protein